MEVIEMKKPNYAIHTFEVRRYLKPKEYQMLLDALFEKSKNNFRAYPDGPEMVFDIFGDKDIRTHLIRHKQNPYLALIINLKAVEQSGNLIDLTSFGDEFTNSYHTTDKMITDFFGEEYALDKLELCRIDFSVNIDVGSRENVKTYIHILNHRAGVPKGYKIKGRKCKEIDLSKGYLADNKNAGGLAGNLRQGSSAH